MKKIIIVLLICVSTIIKTYAQDNSAMSRLMSSWVNEDINTVIDQWGFPTEEKTIANRHIYSWKFNNYTQYGQYGAAVEKYCLGIFEVNKYNFITSWQWKGNNCPITYAGVKSKVNPENNYWLEKQKKKELEKAKKKVKNI